MADHTVKLSAQEKTQLHNNQPVLVAFGAGPTADSFWIDPRHQPGFMQHMWDEQDAGREVVVLAVMETDRIMDTVEIVP